MLETTSPTIAARIAAALTGHRCFACERASVRMVCAACEDGLPGARRGRCSVCAIALASGTVCGACLSSAPAYDASFAAWDYAAKLDALVRALKFGQALGLARVFAQHLSAKLPAGLRADIVAPVPLSPQRLAQRGYNQAWEVVRHLPAALGPRDWRVLARVIDTAPQTDLPFDARRKNIRGAFVVNAQVKDKTVLLVDDVMTTGSTLHEAARTLKRAGAARVINLVVARTP